MSMSDMLSVNNVDFPNQRRITDDKSIATRQQEVLKAYRVASGYTIRALEDAIEDISKSVSKASNRHITDILLGRKSELESALSVILNDADR